MKISKKIIANLKNNNSEFSKKILDILFTKDAIKVVKN